MTWLYDLSHGEVFVLAVLLAVAMWAIIGTTVCTAVYFATREPALHRQQAAAANTVFAPQASAQPEPAKPATATHTSPAMG
jgi:hypothetical protein